MQGTMPATPQALEPRQVWKPHLPAVDVHAAELGAAVELGEDLAGVEDLGRVEGAFDALLLIQVVLVEHHRHQVALLDADPVLAGEAAADIDAELGGVAPVFETCIRYAERPAKAVRDTGQLPHELRSRAEAQHKARFERMRAKKRAAESEPVLAPSISNLAQDYAALTQEFVDVLLAAESQMRGRHRS